MDDVMKDKMKKGDQTPLSSRLRHRRQIKDIEREKLFESKLSLQTSEIVDNFKPAAKDLLGNMKRHDVIAWLISMAFIIGLLGAMWGWGNARGWNAQSGYYYDDVENTESRFDPEPFFCNETSVPGRSGNSCTSTWYFWKLPTNEVTVLSRAMVWLFYCLHQVFVWGLIYRAQLVKSMSMQDKGSKKYGTKLSWYNWALLIVNGLFHILHLVQTHWTYDGTAQDTIISSSQGSVIMMLCFILLMEYRDRGFMFMWPNSRSNDKFAKYLKFHPGPIHLIRKYHGFAFAWASIYTFWYHPMENTWAHTLGFFHTAIVLLQGSLIYTDFHLNRYWRLLNEAWVLIHATVVAVQTQNPAGNGQWTIFAFGFGFIFAFTQVYSFPFWKKISPYFRIIPIIVYFAVVSALCATIVKGENGQSGFSRIYEMFFIPAEEYMMFIFSWLFLYIFVVIEGAIIGEKKVNENPEISATKQAAYLCGVLVIYALFIVISYLTRHVTGDLILYMIIFVFIFTLGVCITVMFFKQLMGPFRKVVKKTKVSQGNDKTPEEVMPENLNNNAYVTEKF